MGFSSFCGINIQGTNSQHWSSVLRYIAYGIEPVPNAHHEDWYSALVDEEEEEATDDFLAIVAEFSASTYWKIGKILWKSEKKMLAMW